VRLSSSSWSCASAVGGSCGRSKTCRSRPTAAAAPGYSGRRAVVYYCLGHCRLKFACCIAGIFPRGSRQACVTRAEQQAAAYAAYDMLLANRPPSAAVWCCQSRHLLHNTALLRNASLQPYRLYRLHHAHREEWRWPVVEFSLQ
jgi:hypothetical protein